MAAVHVERIGTRIRARRKELGLRQEDVARQLPGRTTAQQVSKWERGLHRPQDDTLEHLAEALGVDVAYFMVANGDKSGPTPDPLGASQLDRIEAKVDKALALLRAQRATKAPPAPPGELGRKKPAAQPTPEPKKRPRRRRAQGE